MHPYQNFGISWALLQNKTTIGANFKIKKEKKSNEQKQKTDKTKFSNKPLRVAFSQLKEAKNPSKISLLLHTKRSKLIFKITNELSTTQERFLLQKLSIKQKNLSFVCV